MLPALPALSLPVLVISPLPPRAVRRIEPSGPWLTLPAEITPRELTTACLVERASITIAPPAALSEPLEVLDTDLARVVSVVRL